MAAGLGDEIESGDAGVGRAVGDEFGDVLGANEDGLEDSAERRGQCPLSASDELESGLVEERSRLLGEASLVWNGDAKHAGNGCDRSVKNA